MRIYYSTDFSNSLRDKYSDGRENDKLINLSQPTGAFIFLSQSIYR
jgi:hypothetical protein